MRWVGFDIIFFSNSFHCAERKSQLKEWENWGLPKAGEWSTSGWSWGKLNVAFLILFGANFPWSLEKGNWPVSSLKRRTPQLHISLSLRFCLLHSFSWWYSSGEVYSFNSMLPHFKRGYSLSSLSSPSSLPPRLVLAYGSWERLMAGFAMVVSVVRSWELEKLVSWRWWCGYGAIRTEKRLIEPWVMFWAFRLSRMSTSWQKISCTSFSMSVCLRYRTFSRGIPHLSMTK